jgi:methyl halide transferase
MPHSADSENYWSERYSSGDIPWDTGGITTPLKEYADQLTAHDLKILIPGAGNAHEGEYLFRKGFRNIYIADISDKPLRAFRNRCPEFPENNLLHGDFFDLKGAYDLILEQTFFCALPPGRRKEYVQKCYELLKPGGKLTGVLFDDPLNSEHPPYGGNLKEYEKLFIPPFRKLVMERCYNSISPRTNKEVFISLEKPAH